MVLLLIILQKKLLQRSEEQEMSDLCFSHHFFDALNEPLAAASSKLFKYHKKYQLHRSYYCLSLFLCETLLHNVIGEQYAHWSGLLILDLNCSYFGKRNEFLFPLIDQHTTCIRVPLVCLQLSLDNHSAPLSHFGCCQS